MSLKYEITNVALVTLQVFECIYYNLKKYSLIWYITFPKQKYCNVLIMQYVCHVVNSDYTSNLCIYLALSRRIYSQSGSMHIFHFFCFVCLHKQNCTHQTTLGLVLCTFVVQSGGTISRTVLRTLLLVHTMNVTGEICYKLDLWGQGNLFWLFIMFYTRSLDERMSKVFLVHQVCKFNLRQRMVWWSGFSIFPSVSKFNAKPFISFSKRLSLFSQIDNLFVFLETSKGSLTR